MRKRVINYDLKSKIMTQITIDMLDAYVSFFMKSIKNFDVIKVKS